MSKIVFITETNSGFGRLMAISLSKAGHTVIAGMRGTVGTYQAIAKELSVLSKVEVVKIDVADDGSVAHAFHYVLDKYKNIDVLINNAGVTAYGLLEASSLEQIHNVFEVNFFGIARTCQAVLPGMRKAKKGLIINITFGPGGHKPAFSIPYFASAFGVKILTEGLQDELAQFGIENVWIQPGIDQTEIGNSRKVGFAVDRPEIAMEYNPVATEMFHAAGAGLFGEMADLNLNLQTITDEVLALINTEKGARPLRLSLNSIARETEVSLLTQ